MGGFEAAAEAKVRWVSDSLHQRFTSRSTAGESGRLRCGRGMTRRDGLTAAEEGVLLSRAADPTRCRPSCSSPKASVCPPRPPVYHALGAAGQWVAESVSGAAR